MQRLFSRCLNETSEIGTAKEEIARHEARFATSLDRHLGA